MPDIRRAIEFITDDPRASTKIALGGLLLLAPIANVVVVGYQVEVTRAVARAEPRPLPEWKDFSRLFVTGAWLSLANVVYILPLLAGLLIGVLAGFAWLLQAAQAAGPDQGPSIGPAIIVGGLCMLAVLMAYTLVFSFIHPAILTEYARLGAFAACFDFPAILRVIQRDPGDYVLLWLSELGIGLGFTFVAGAAGFVLSIIPCVGSLATLVLSAVSGFLVLLVNAHLAGQLLRSGANSVSSKES